LVTKLVKNYTHFKETIVAEKKEIEALKTALLLEKQGKRRSGTRVISGPSDW